MGLVQTYRRASSPRTAADSERWMYNFIGGAAQKTLLVEVVAAENNGWRARVGLSEGGKVIEKHGLSGEWFHDFAGAVKHAKSLARKYKIPWNPQHYSTDKPHKPGTPPPEEG